MRNSIILTKTTFIPHGFHGFHADSAWNRGGTVKCSKPAPNWAPALVQDKALLRLMTVSSGLMHSSVCWTLASSFDCSTSPPVERWVQWFNSWEINISVLICESRRTFWRSSRWSDTFTYKYQVSQNQAVPKQVSLLIQALLLQHC